MPIDYPLWQICNPRNQPVMLHLRIFYGKYTAYTPHTNKKEV